MFPTLYDSSVTAYRWLGIGKLAETISCTVYEELNGERSLEFEYPVTGTYFDELTKEGRSIAVTAPVYSYSGNTFGVEKDTTLFDIYAYSEPINGVVTFQARHAGQRLANRVVVTNSITRNNIKNVISGNLAVGDIGLPVIVWLNGIPSGSSFSVSSPKSVLSALIGESESGASEWGVDFAIETEKYDPGPSGGPASIRMVVYTARPRGIDNAAEIHFGRNLKDVTRTKDMSGTYNAVVPFWQNAGTIKYVSGYLVQPTTAITPIKAVPMDLTGEFDEEPTETEMIDFARAHLDNDQPWIGEDTITANFENGASFKEGQQAALGDIVHVYWDDGKIDTKMRVMAYRYDVILEKFTEMTLGTLSKQYVAVTGLPEGGAVSSAAAEQAGSSVSFDTNSAVPPIFTSVSGRIRGSYTYRAKVLSLYLNLDSPPSSGGNAAVLAENVRPASGYAVSPLYSSASPYNTVGSAWIDSNGNLRVYYTGTPQYAFFCYAVK